jgi:hypothetical protein
MKGIQETTGGEFPAHTYFMTRDGEAIYAYYNVIKGVFVFFRRSMKFYKSGRKFVKVDFNG